MNELLRLLRIWNVNVEALSADLSVDDRCLAIEAHLNDVDLYAWVSAPDRERVPVATFRSATDADITRVFRWLSTGEMP